MQSYTYLSSDAEMDDVLEEAGVKTVSVCISLPSTELGSIQKGSVQCAEVERVQKYCTQVKVPLHY